MIVSRPIAEHQSVVGGFHCEGEQALRLPEVSPELILLPSLLTTVYALDGVFSGK